MNAGQVQIEAVKGLYFRAVEATVQRAVLPLYQEAGLPLPQGEAGKEQASHGRYTIDWLREAPYSLAELAAFVPTGWHEMERSAAQLGQLGGPRAHGAGLEHANRGRPPRGGRREAGTCTQTSPWDFTCSGLSSLWSPGERARNGRLTRNNPINAAARVKP